MQPQINLISLEIVLDSVRHEKNVSFVAETRILAMLPLLVIFDVNIAGWPVDC